MRFLRRTMNVDADLKAANEEATKRVSKIKKKAVDQATEFIDGMKELQGQLEKVIGATPEKGVDLQAFHRFMKKHLERKAPAPSNGANGNGQHDAPPS